MIKEMDWWKQFYEKRTCLVCRRDLYHKRKDNHSTEDLWTLNKYSRELWIHAEPGKLQGMTQNPFLGHSATPRRWWHSIIPRRYWRYEED